jgi:hypothetical protein
MATPGERALGLLHVLRERDRLFSRDSRSGEPGEQGRIAGTVGALVSVDLLTLDQADAILSSDGSELRAAASGAGDRAGRLLTGLIDAAESEGEREGMAGRRFRGALEALADIGLVDRDEWDRLLRRRTGRPTAEEERAITRQLNAGGTEQELIAVVPGSPEAVDGLAVLYALWFTDGISLVCSRVPGIEESKRGRTNEGRWNWRDCELRDDVGTVYEGGSSGGSEHNQHTTFRTPPPTDASWIELVNPAGNAIRLRL